MLIVPWPCTQEALIAPKKEGKLPESLAVIASWKEPGKKSWDKQERQWLHNVMLYLVPKAGQWPQIQSRGSGSGPKGSRKGV